MILSDNIIIFGYIISWLLFAWTSEVKLLYSYFKNYLQILDLDLKFVTIWKIKFKYLKIVEMFL
jgi:hypothetical protein